MTSFSTEPLDADAIEAFELAVDLLIEDQRWEQTDE